MNLYTSLHPNFFSAGLLPSWPWPPSWSPCPSGLSSPLPTPSGRLYKVIFIAFKVRSTVLTKAFKPMRPSTCLSHPSSTLAQPNTHPAHLQAHRAASLLPRPDASHSLLWRVPAQSCTSQMAPHFPGEVSSDSPHLISCPLCAPLIS